MSAGLTMHEVLLASTLSEIERNEKNYAVREGLVYGALAQAKQMGYKAGVRVDPADLEWPIVCIELPGIGEVAWHCPAFDAKYVPYDTAEKYERCRRYAAKVKV